MSKFFPLMKSQAQPPSATRPIAALGHALAMALLFGAAGQEVGEGRPFTSVGTLLGVLVLSVVCSFSAGASTAVIAMARAGRAVLVMALLLLISGIAVQASVWSLMPVWYHLTFLALIVPISLVGGRCMPGRSSAVPAH